ncbi:MAG: hypothetical protein ACOYJK_01470 [Prevotella sp.]|jgi:hypothetical protein
MKRWKIIVGVLLLAALGLADYALWDFADFGLKIYKSANDSTSQIRTYAMSLVDELGIALLVNYIVVVYLYVKWVLTRKRKRERA